MLVLADAIVVAVSMQLAYLARFEGPPPAFFAAGMPAATLAAIVVYVMCAWLLGLYRHIWRYMGADTFLKIGAGVLSGFCILLAADMWFGGAMGGRPVPIGTLAISAAFVMIGMTSVRGGSRAFLWLSSRVSDPNASRVLIVGAGDAGSLLLRDIENQPKLGLRVVGFLDDDPRKIGRRLRNVPILGPVDSLREEVRRLEVSEVYIALPSADQNRRQRIHDICASLGVVVKTTAVLARGQSDFGISYFHQLSLEDLLGREPVRLDTTSLTSSINTKTILVTGAAGSIGSELCRQVARFGPRRLVMLDNDESRLNDVWLELTSANIGNAEMVIADIRNTEKTREIIARVDPDLVLHAAAYKHVPLMESAPDEAVLANVLGTRNVVEACRAVGSRFLLISTDKAVEPSSVMGVTKLIAERVTLHACSQGLKGNVVRFGNVLGSRGSVVPLFEQQLRRGGPIYVTHPDVTRYFMTIPEAASLVLQAQAVGLSGSIMILDMGEPVRIVDLAEKMIKVSRVQAEIVYSGLRPAEKLHEVLVGADERLMPTDHEKVLMVSSTPVASPSVPVAVERLIAAATRRDNIAISAAFEALCPGFILRNEQARNGAADRHDRKADVDVVEPTDGEQTLQLGS